MDGQPHVGHAELREDRAVHEFDHRVHDRLRVDHDVDAGRRRTPNSQCASMTSSPLFISVAESIVIFRPIRQVGCCRASSGRHACQVGRGLARGTVRRRRSAPAGAPRPAARPCRHWWMALCSLSTGRIGNAASPCGLRHDAARHDQHFLVGEGDGLARLDGREHRFQGRRPGRGAEHQVDVGVRGHRHEPFDTVPGAAMRPRHGWRRRAASRPRRRGHGRERGAGTARPAPRTARRSVRRRGRPPRAGRRCASTTDSALRPMEPVEPRMAMRFTSSRPISVVSHRNEEQVEGRRGEQQRVDPIEDAAVPGNQARSCPSRRRCA